MTNNEARDKLIELKGMLKAMIKFYYGTEADVSECFDIAIKALENQTKFMIYSNGTMEQIIEPCEDCISRAEAIKAVREAYSIYIPRMNGWEKGLPLKIDKAIYDLPSIQPKPKTDVLDKIRAEIEQLTITKGGEDYVRTMAELFSLKMKVLQIIDKYTAESEE